MNSIAKKDKFGPEYLIEVYDPSLNMNGFLVIDSTVLGPGKGGLRMTPDTTAGEVFRLARVMTWKNALSGLPFGGAKAGIVWPPVSVKTAIGKNRSSVLKKKFIQSFAKMIKPFLVSKYISAPDINTGQKEMKWFIEAAGNRKAATGKPVDLGGLPHELGSTGFGVAQAALEAAKFKGLDIRGATVAIDGFGNVGSFTFKYLSEAGAKIIALADRHGAIYDKNGLDFNEIKKIKSRRLPVSSYQKGKPISRDRFFSLPTDILIPASTTDVVNEKNKNKIKVGIIVEGANIPMSEKIEDELFKKGILIVPDFVANAGGVISSYAEHRGYNAKKMFAIVKRKISKTVNLILGQSAASGKNPRLIAMKMAAKRLKI